MPLAVALELEPSPKDAAPPSSRRTIRALASVLVEELEVLARADDPESANKRDDVRLAKALAHNILDLLE